MQVAAFVTLPLFQVCEHSASIATNLFPCSLAYVSAVEFLYPVDCCIKTKRPLLQILQFCFLLLCLSDLCKNRNAQYSILVTLFGIVTLGSD